jgi:hypothetical protein
MQSDLQRIFEPNTRNPSKSNGKERCPSWGLPRAYRLYRANSFFESIGLLTIRSISVARAMSAAIFSLRWREML